MSRKQKWNTKDLQCKTEDLRPPLNLQNQIPKAPLNLKNEYLRPPLQISKFALIFATQIVCLSRFDSCSTAESLIYPVRTCDTLTVQNDKTEITVMLFLRTSTAMDLMAFKHAKPLLIGM